MRENMAKNRKSSLHEIQDHPDNETDAEENTKKLKYPRAIFFIVCNEFCERFSFYGMRTILTLYLRDSLKYSENTSIVIYHVFTMFVYFFPILGAILADSLLGKFRTIFYISIIYAAGQLLISLSAAPVIGLPPREFSIVGLILVAIGTGGIKPCVAAFGGDQFILPQQERYLSTFFSLFYFSINSGSLISSFITPILRNEACFGETTCYSLAFLIPAILMSISVVIFVAGKPLYKIVQPSGNVVLDVSKCVSHAIYNKVTSKGTKKEHWLDHADDEYEPTRINDIKAALQVLKLFLPLPIFWALYDQQGSRWTIQATRMDGQIGSYLIQPDQMQVVNPLLVLAFIPLFEYCIYPLLEKINLHTPLKKLTIGGLLAVTAFVASGLVEFKLEETYPILPTQGVGQLRIFNTLNCPVPMVVGEETFTLKKMDMWQNIDIKIKDTDSLKYSVDFTECNTAGFTSRKGIETGFLSVNETESISYAFTPLGISSGYADSIKKSISGAPLVRGLVYIDESLPDESFNLNFLQNGEEKGSVGFNSSSPSDLLELKSGTYNIYINNEKVQSDVEFKLGGVYTVVGSITDESAKKKPLTNTVVVTQPNSMSMLWLIPQYVLLTLGEVMFSVTGLEFAFTQAPVSMKSLLQASWHLTVAFGNLIVVIITEVSFFDRQVFEFFLFAGLMFIDMIIFAIMASFYKYVDVPDDETIAEDINMDIKNGVVNESFKNDEK